RIHARSRGDTRRRRIGMGCVRDRARRRGSFGRTEVADGDGAARGRRSAISRVARARAERSDERGSRQGSTGADLAITPTLPPLAVLWLVRDTPRVMATGCGRLRPGPQTRAAGENEDADALFAALEFHHPVFFVDEARAPKGAHRGDVRGRCDAENLLQPER